MGRERVVRFDDILIKVDNRTPKRAVDRSIIIDKHNVYADRGKWKIPFNHLKLDANEAGEICIFTEDRHKMFICHDRSTEKVLNFIDILKNSHSKWKEKRRQIQTVPTNTTYGRRRYTGTKSYGKRSKNDKLEQWLHNQAKYVDDVDVVDEIEDPTEDHEDSRVQKKSRRSVCLQDEDDDEIMDPEALSQPVPSKPAKQITDENSEGTKEKELEQSTAEDDSQVETKSVAITDEESLEDQSQTKIPDTPTKESSVRIPPVTPNKAVTVKSAQKAISSYFPTPMKSKKGMETNKIIKDNPNVTPQSEVSRKRPKFDSTSSTSSPWRETTTPVSNLVSASKLISSHNVRGLRNSGNTCYINSSLQALYSLPSLLSLLRSVSSETKNAKLVHSILKVHKSNHCDASPVKQTMDSYTNKYHGYEQRDAHEFLSDMIDHMDTELAIKESSSSNPIDLYFRMDIRVCLSCDACGYKRSKDELYRDISLDISSSTALSTALKKFFTPEQLNLKCEHCSEGMTATRTMKIIRLPKVLLLHLKRFVVNSDGSLSKNKTDVSFDENISLAQYSSEDVTVPCLNYTPSSPKLIKDMGDAAANTSKSLSYQLKAIVHHIGSRLNSGHYIADVLALQPANLVEEKQEEIPGKWLRLDDSHVTDLTWGELVSKDSQQNSYMMLYELNT